MKSDFKRFLPALTALVCFLAGFAGAVLIVGRAATTRYETLQTEFAEYKSEVAGYEHFVDFYPTCDTIVVSLDSVPMPPLFNISDFVRWQNGISQDTNHTKITFHGFTLNFSGVEVIRDTIKLVLPIDQNLDTVKKARRDALISFLTYEPQITRLQAGQILSQDFTLIQKMAHYIGGDLYLIKYELEDEEEKL